MEAFLSPSLVGKTPATATFPKFQRADSEQLLKKEKAAMKAPEARLQGREKCVKVRRPITWDPVRIRLLQSRPTPCNPMDGSPPGSSVHGILQARILEWVAMPSSSGSPQPRDRTHVSYIYLHWPAGSLPAAPPGDPSHTLMFFTTLPWTICYKTPDQILPGWDM